MKWLIVGLVWALIALLTVVLAALGLVRSRLRQRHRIDPKVPSPVPLTWVVAPQAPARLHRRLCRAMAVARQALAQLAARPQGLRITLRRRKVMPSPLVALVTDLQCEALAIDEHLALAARFAPAQRRLLVQQLEGQVVDVERLAARIALLGVRAAAPAVRIDDQPALAELEAQVDQLEVARTIIEATQHEVGLASLPRMADEPMADEPDRTWPSPGTPERAVGRR